MHLIDVEARAAVRSMPRPFESPGALPMDEQARIVGVQPLRTSLFPIAHAPGMCVDFATARWLSSRRPSRRPSRQLSR